MHANIGNREGSQLIDSPVGMIHCVREGKKAGPTLVFLHGNYFSLPIWDGWINHLKQDYNIIRLDLPGFGLSHPPRKKQYTDGGDLAAVKSVFDAYNIHKAHMIGTVLGGKTAYQFAAHHTDRTQSLTLINSAGLPNHAADPLKVTEIPDEVTQTILTSPETFLDQLFQGLKGPQGRIDRQLTVELTRLSSRPHAIKQIVKRMQEYTVGHAASTLAKITCPALIMHGTNNIQYSPSDTGIFDKMLRKSPRKTIHHYEGYGHLLPLESCHQALKDLQTFLVDNS